MEGEPSYIDIDVDRIFASDAIISPREREVLSLITQGDHSKDIARKLFISPETVDKHRKNMLRKTNVSSTAELVTLAIRKGWI
jgi:two-component system secretion response regulator SsrB